MIKAVIVDDSPEARESLTADITRWCPDVSITATAGSMKEGLSKLKELKPDVVFLDIQLGDGDGFSLLEQLGSTDTQVIFTTGLDSEGIRAIKFSALDYLLKPVDPDELVTAVEKLKEAREKQSFGENIRLLAEHLNAKQGKNEVRRLALNSSDKVQVVRVDEIIRCESERNYTTFFLKDGKQIVVTRTLKEYEELLEPLGFVRVHHSHLINLEYLKEFIKSDGGYALMSDKAQVPVSVRKRDDLMKALGM